MERLLLRRLSARSVYYYDLLPIMQDRASSEPKITSYDLDDDDDENENDEIKEDDDMSDISDGEGGTKSIRSVGSKTSASKSVATKRTVSSSSTKKKKPRRGRLKTTLMDDDTLTLLSDSKKANEERMKEVARHNKAVESMEQQKFELEKQKVDSMSWKGKSDQLEYKMNLLGRFEELTARGWTSEQIVRFFPDMAEIAAARDS